MLQVSADLIKSILGVYLKLPVETRWNSTLNALVQLLWLYDEKPNEIRIIYEHINVDLLKREQLDFLRQYVKVNLFFSFLTHQIKCYEVHYFHFTDYDSYWKSLRHVSRPGLYVYGHFWSLRSLNDRRNKNTARYVAEK